MDAHRHPVCFDRRRYVRRLGDLLLAAWAITALDSSAATRLSEGPQATAVAVASNGSGVLATWLQAPGPLHVATRHVDLAGAAEDQIHLIAEPGDLRCLTVTASPRNFLLVWQDFSDHTIHAALISNVGELLREVTLTSSIAIVSFPGRMHYELSPPPAVVWNGRAYVVLWLASDNVTHAATLDEDLRITKEIVLDGMHDAPMS